MIIEKKYPKNNEIFRLIDNDKESTIGPFEIFYDFESDGKLSKIPHSYRCWFCECHNYPDQIENNIVYSLVKTPIGEKDIYKCRVCNHLGYKQDKIYGG